MSEAEISSAGAVLVEGHHVGELQGFRFTADQSAGGEDAKAVKAAAQKALGAEYESRADRFAAGANADIALGSDGTLRWIGAPIATLVSGDDPLRPRVVLLADEQLTGQARDKVAARAERFVNYQIDTLLKPLVDLKGADSILGIGRGIAFQLVENFGILNRRDIADDVKSLDQEGRAALRRLGVRFGAYHIFVPALLKPGPAGLVTLLWALTNDGKDKPGFGDVVHALAAGRTSVVVDPTFERAFYKLAGFRMLGRRAVRIDILERLADLIRPALAWKPGTGLRPDGAFDGSGFTVTPPMMSILGANADDIEEILKGLGYRSDARPAAAVKARIAEIDQAARAAAEAAAAKAEADRAAALQAEAAAIVDVAPVASADLPLAAEQDATAEPPTTGDYLPDAQAVETPAVVEPADAAFVAPIGQDQPRLTEAPVQQTGNADVEVSAPPSAEAPEQEPETQAAADIAAIVTGTAEPVADAAAAQSADAAEAPAPVEEPKPILVWRPARFDQHPRHRHDGRGRDAARSGEARKRGDPGQGDSRQSNAREGDTVRPRPDGEVAQRPSGKQRFERKFGGKPAGRRDGERNDGKDAGQRKGRSNGQDAGPKGDRGAAKSWTTQKPREDRPVRVDPDSPFAKLAALRDQLKK